MTPTRPLMAFASLCLAAAAALSLHGLEHASSDNAMVQAVSVAHLSQTGPNVAAWLSEAAAGGPALSTGHARWGRGVASSFSALSGGILESATHATDVVFYADPAHGPATLRIGAGQFRSNELAPASAPMPWSARDIAAISSSGVAGLTATALPDGSAEIRFEAPVGTPARVIWARVDTQSMGKLALLGGAVPASDFAALLAADRANAARFFGAAAEIVVGTALALGAAGMLSPAAPLPGTLGDVASAIASRRKSKNKQASSAPISPPSAP